MVANPYILWLRECGSNSLPEVGGKNASLGEMMRAGIRVPPGFAVTTRAYEEFLLRCRIKREIQEILRDVKPDDMESVERAGEMIHEIIQSSPLPDDIAEAIAEAYGRLGEELNLPDPPVAVRSSATAEDLPDASFAGQQETYLWVRGEEVLKRTVMCWASLFTPRAISYRASKGFPHEKVSISVGVHKMIRARSAGVAFTINPVNGDPSKVVIEANWGLGESVVKGEVTPDRFVVDKVTLEILGRSISPKTMAYLVDSVGSLVVPTALPAERQNSPCLVDEEITELARTAKLIERHYGRPQDVEWAVDEELPFPDNIMILQSRPETVWSQREAQPITVPRETPQGYIMDWCWRRLSEKLS